jgi:hypothetical protein
MFLLGLGIGRLHAQGVSTGRLHGNVQDQLGAAVSGADVVIRNELTGLVRNTVTDDEGYYQADRMPPGTYALGVSKEGFTTWERVHARLEAGQTLRIDPMLAVGAITSKVTVEATSVLVNTTSASFNNVIDTKRVLELPTLQRDLTSFFALNTGVTRPSGGGRTTVTLNGSPQTGSNFTIDGTVILMPQIKAGKFRAIAMGRPQRWPELPDVPTLVEQGYPDFVIDAWTGVVAPAGTPAPIVARLNAVINAGLATPESKETMDRFSSIIKTGTPQEFGAFVADQGQRWGALVKLSGAKVE